MKRMKRRPWYGYTYIIKKYLRLILTKLFLSIKLKMSVKKELPSVKIHSEKLNLNFTVYYQNETDASHQHCYIMTVHDLGCDCKDFSKTDNLKLIIF